MTFRIDKRAGLNSIALGVVPAAEVAKVSSGGANVIRYGYVCDSWGNFYATVPYFDPTPVDDFGFGIEIGDEITVRLNLDASTVAFRKNEHILGTKNIAPGDAYS